VGCRCYCCVSMVLHLSKQCGMPQWRLCRRYALLLMIIVGTATIYVTCCSVLFTLVTGYYRDGRYARTFYTQKDVMYQLHQQRGLKGPFWAREFEKAHYEIDDYWKETPSRSVVRRLRG
jgi:hypothetical protein